MKRPVFYIKKTLKILSIIILVFLTLIILLSVVAKIKEKEIADIVLKKISESIHIPIVIDDISLSLIRRFPLATIALKDVWIGSPDAFNSSDSLISEEETLAKIEKIYLSVKSRPLFKGEFEIMKVEIKGVSFSYIVDKHGISNFDFLIDTTQKDIADTASLNLNVMLKKLLLKDIHCNYYDSLNLISARLEIPKAEVKGEMKKDFLEASAKGMLKLSNCTYKSTNLHLMRETNLDFDVDYCKDTVDLRDFVITTDGAEFAVTGSVVIKDTIKTDLHILGTHINMGELVKYIPDKTSNDMGLKKISGMLTMEATVKGFIADSILPEVKMEVGMKNGTIQYIDYPVVKNISFDGSLTNGKMRNNKTTVVSIWKLHAETRQSSVDMSCSINNLDRIHYKINSDIRIDIGEFKKYIPDTIVADARGQLRARFATKGVLPDSIGNDFIEYMLETSQLDLSFNNVFIALDSSLSLNSLSGHLAYDQHHITAGDLYASIPSYGININNTSFDALFSGKVSKLSNAGIDVKSFQIKTDSCAFDGSAKIQNLEAPEYYISSTMKLNLREIKTILPDTLVNDLSGEITVRITSGGKLDLDSISSQIKDLIFEKSTFDIHFNRVSADMPDTLLSIKEFSGNISMKPGIIEINDLHGIYSGIDFSIDSTKIVNLYRSVIMNQASQLYVEGRFNLGDLDYSMFVPFLEEKTDTNITPSDNKDPASKTTNYSYLFKGKIGVKSFTYNKAMIDNLSALFNLSDSLYIVDQFKFDGFGGKHNTSIRYSVKGEDKTLWVKNKADNMDVARLLKDFDNFKEYYDPAITYENISGFLSSTVDGQILFKGDSLIMNKLYVRGNIKLERGGIYNYQPVIDMEKYLKGLGSLNKLEFKTINSNIFVFQDAIYVPKTLVVSNKLDATAMGMKSFGEDYSYHFMVFLSDILAGKSKKRIEKQDAIGDEISGADRKGTMVKSYSIDGKHRSGLDNVKDQNEMKRKIKASEKLLDVRFHPNTVNFNTGVN